MIILFGFGDRRQLNFILPGVINRPFRFLTGTGLKLSPNPTTRSLPMRIFLPSTLVLMASLAACGGDSTGPGNNGGGEKPRAVNTSEANAISRVLLGPGVGVAQSGVNGRAPSGSRQSGGYSAAIETGQLPFGFTAPCTPSGSVNVTGTLNAAWEPLAQWVAVNAQVTLRHQACPVQTDNGILTVTGDPAINLSLTAGGDATGVKFLILTEQGAVLWTRADGTSGRCAADVIGAAVAGTPNYHVTGTVCGIKVDFTGPL
jgi:hypothetical protein